MKRIIGIIVLFGCLLTGCTKGYGPLKEGGPGEYTNGGGPVQRNHTAIVTVKQDEAGLVFLQLDDNLCLYPRNYPEPFIRECRIICELSWWEGATRCEMGWMDYLQEGPVQSEPLAAGDGVDIIPDWMTSVEDGYLTLHYSTLWGYGQVPHSLILVTGENPEDPYEVRLVHLNNGDPALEKADALVYFDLSSLPPTGGSAQTLTLKWINSAGQTDSRTYLFRSRQ